MIIRRTDANRRGTSAAIFLAGVFTVFLSNHVIRADPPSQMFRPEGHLGRYYYSPDDERSRITASEEVVTRHIRWTVPAAKEPLHVLAIAHKHWGRWPVELSQRFDFRIHTVYTHGPAELGVPVNHASHGASGRINQRPGDVEARLLAALNRPLDVVVSDVPMATLTDRVRQRLAEVLDRGVGFVATAEGLPLTGHERAAEAEGQLVRAALPVAGLASLPEDAAGTVVQLWETPARNRVVDLSRYPWDQEPAPSDRLIHLELLDMRWEAWCSLTGRAMLWAAGRLPARSVVSVQASESAISRDELPLRQQLDRETDRPTSMRIWDADGRLRHTGQDLMVPRLQAGDYFVGLQQRTDSGVVDWSFTFMPIMSSHHITAIELNSRLWRIDDTIHATIRLNRELAGGSLRLELIDNFGRVFARREVSAKSEVSFDAKLQESRHIYNYVNVTLLNASGEAVHETRRAFLVRQRALPYDDLMTMLWSPVSSYDPRRRIIQKEFGRMGIDSGVSEKEIMTDFNVRPVVVPFHLRVDADEDGHMKPNIASPESIRSRRHRVAEYARKINPYSPLFFYLGDDIRFTQYGTDSGWSAPARASLARWSERRYRRIEDLNRAWGTSYRAFDQVEPIRHADTLAGIRETNPPDYPGLCHWIDVALHQDEMMARYFQSLGEAVHEVMPDVPSNFGSTVVGWTWPGGGFDFWQLSEGKRLGFQYPNPWVHDIYRCSLAPDALHGVWYGGYGLYNVPPAYLDMDYLPWWSVFHGINLHGLYYGGTVPAWHDERLLAADLTPLPGVAKIHANITELKRGTAKLLFNAERTNDGIAMVYAPSALHASVVFDQGLPRDPQWEGQPGSSHQTIYMQCWEGMAYMLRDLGLSFDVIPAKHIRANRLLARGIRMLVMPLNLQVTEEEAAAIRNFVDAGGVVVADAMPGFFDDHFGAAHEGVLSDVFGVTYPGGIPDQRVRFESMATNEGVELPDAAVDTGISSSESRAMAHSAGGTPTILVNRVGNGTGILLNVLARDYQIWRTTATELPFREVLGRVLGQAGIKPYPGLKCSVNEGSDSEHPLQATEVHRYALGRGRYVGLLRHAKLRPDGPVFMADLRPKPVWIRFEQTAHVYDVRRGMYRGYGDRIEDMIYPARAELYALLPYEVRGLHMRCDQTGGTADVSGHIVTDNDHVTTDHVFRIEFTEPNGRYRPELSANLIGSDGRFQHRVFVGYNATPGDWTVKVRDVATGTVREAMIRF